jgi:hypothetical protein
MVVRPVGSHLGAVQFGEGNEVGALKLWLVEEHKFDPSSLVRENCRWCRFASCRTTGERCVQVLTLDGAPMLDILSLVDFEAIKASRMATIVVEGEIDDSRPTETEPVARDALEEEEA